jgi:D,D-heptose 1,7-bisphosphate phosphatase
MKPPGPNSMDKAIFMDKDGTLIKNIPFNIEADKIELYKDVPSAIRKLKEYGFKIIVVTNQPGIAFGYFNENEFKNFVNFFYKFFSEQGCEIDGFYYCPHHPDGKDKTYGCECSCRKPAPGMILKASEDLAIDLSQSWMIGDILHDVEAGKKAGCRTILIDNGNETEWVLTKNRNPLFIAKKVIEAAGIIIRHTEIEVENIKRG